MGRTCLKAASFVSPISLADRDDQCVGVLVCAVSHRDTQGRRRRHQPEFETLAIEFRDHGVQFLGVDVRDNRQSARDVVTDREVSYPSIFDPEMRSLITGGLN